MSIESYNISLKVIEAERSVVEIRVPSLNDRVLDERSENCSLGYINNELYEISKGFLERCKSCQAYKNRYRPNRGDFSIQCSGFRITDMEKLMAIVVHPSSLTPKQLREFAETSMICKPNISR